MVAAPAYSEHSDSGNMVIQENTFVAQGVGTSSIRVLTTLGSQGLWDDLTYKTLIQCLAKYESSYNPTVVGKAGEIGLLQFMPTTWSMYCKGNIYSAYDQVQCCDEMLKNDFENLGHWTTRFKCFK